MPRPAFLTLIERRERLFPERATAEVQEVHDDDTSLVAVRGGVDFQDLRLPRPEGLGEETHLREVHDGDEVARGPHNARRPLPVGMREGEAGHGILLEPGGEPGPGESLELGQLLAQGATFDLRGVGGTLAHLRGDAGVHSPSSEVQG